MKSILTCLVFGIGMMYTAAGYSQSDNYSGNVKYAAAGTPGTVTVTSTGIGKTRVKSENNATASALYVLLFRGIVGSQYELPMIPKENEKKNHPAVKSLLNNGYSTFITESSFISEESQKVKKKGVKGKMASYRITINCDAVRKYLEQNDVIRKFGI